MRVVAAVGVGMGWKAEQRVVAPSWQKAERLPSTPNMHQDSRQAGLTPAALTAHAPRKPLATGAAPPAGSCRMWSCALPAERLGLGGLGRLGVEMGWVGLAVGFERSGAFCRFVCSCWSRLEKTLTRCCNICVSNRQTHAPIRRRKPDATTDRSPLAAPPPLLLLSSPRPPPPPLRCRVDAAMVCMFLLARDCS